MNIAFEPMSKQSMTHCFKLWKKENVNEIYLTGDEIDGYKWFFALDNNTKNVVGFVALLSAPEVNVVPVSLEIIYVYPVNRHQGLSVDIRNALVKQKNLGALTIGRYVNDTTKLEKHRIVSKKSGFNTHCVVGCTVNGKFTVHADVFLRDGVEPDKAYNYPFSSLPISLFNKIKGLDIEKMAGLALGVE